MKFSKTITGYQATRKDGQIINIEKYEDGGWVVRYKGDDYGDNTDFAATKKQLVDAENRIEAIL